MYKMSSELYGKASVVCVENEEQQLQQQGQRSREELQAAKMRATKEEEEQNTKDKARIALLDRSEEVQIQVDTFLAGFTLFGIAFASEFVEQIIDNDEEAHALALQLMAFGGFVCAVYCHALYLQREQPTPTWYEELLVQIGRQISNVALVLLLTSVAITANIQMKENYRGYWILAVSVMVVLVMLPILLDLLISLNRYGRRTKLVILYDVILRIDWLCGKMRHCCSPIATAFKFSCLDRCVAFLKCCLRRDQWESTNSNNPTLLKDPPPTSSTARTEAEVSGSAAKSTTKNRSSTVRTKVETEAPSTE